MLLGVHTIWGSASAPTATYFCTSSPCCLSAIPVAVTTAGALCITPLVANAALVHGRAIPDICVLSGPSAVAFVAAASRSLNTLSAAMMTGGYERMTIARGG
jgi:hypothetical protein